MSRPPLAREAVLDAFSRILVDEGERAATMDATARAAGVSKGGLLYHFSSKSALEAALVERLERLAEEDVAEIERSNEGVVAAHLRSSQNTGSPLDLTILAVSRLAQNGSDAASASLRRVRELWEESLRAHTRDETALQMVLLVSDGLYFNAVLDLNAVAGPALEGADLDALIARVVASAT
ncbi:AcrR family transcriptional regulator [Microbacterium testaceum]|uniref:TetR/AcrR family transcriptional regulator n=1 Tax=Microbacterium TaxID=33882 RepID=UPI002783EFDF|nr:MULTISPECIES: TetR/AcrR family transcriptional regulator [Microbacterium]MDQ1110666.1 AcrR family transcriptional regulator [Microbacterium testaceum]MDR6098787.1 AcrR family transcriptional regulator [Microbacterium sp. SORGH_AS_0454]